MAFRGVGRGWRARTGGRDWIWGDHLRSIVDHRVGNDVR